MPDDMTTLERLRKDAGLSQTDIATYLELSQSQVSRYEKMPDDVPMGIYRQWEAYCGKVSAQTPLSYSGDDPLAEARQRYELIDSYLETAPEIPESVKADEIADMRPVEWVEDVRASIQHSARKPRLGLFGRFDMGKSQLANLLMGVDSLPASYQPTTRITCLIRHIQDKPAWQPEPVWIMGTDFSLDRPDDESHCRDQRLIGGGYEILRDYGVHGARSGEFVDTRKAAAAVVYIDSPFLLGCDLIDLPGYANDASDDQRAEMARPMVDVMFYVANITGFMNAQDRLYLAQLVRNLPAFETPDNGVPALRNLYVVATRADIASEPKDEILARATRRCFEIVGPALEDRAEATGVPVDQDTLNSRFFTYSKEEPGLRSALESDLRDLLGTVAPRHVLNRMDDMIHRARASNTQACERAIAGIERAIKARQEAQSEIRALEDNEPVRVQRQKEQEQRVFLLIDELEDASLKCAREQYDWHFKPKRVEKFIKKRFKDKDEAKQLAPGSLIERFNQDINLDTQRRAEQLSNEVDAFLDSYALNIDGNKLSVDLFAFDARGVFAASLAGFGTFGALSAWATVVAAGSNLGGYILAAKIASMLGIIGIDVGGAVGATTALSVIGGPITIGIGLAVSVAIIVAVLTIQSWQQRLAKAICNKIKKEGLLETVQSQLKEYWKETREAFRHAAARTEEDYKKNIEQLKTIAFTTDVEVLEANRDYLKALRDFFAGIPWRAIN